MVDAHTKRLTEQLACRRPVARLHLAETVGFEQCVLLRAWNTLHVWELQAKAGLPQLPACCWCGLPTGNWCDDCGGGGTATAICTGCEERRDNCRRCCAGH